MHVTNPAAGSASLDDLRREAELASLRGEFDRADELYTRVCAEVERGPSPGDLKHLAIVHDHARVDLGLRRWAAGEDKLWHVLVGREKLAGRAAASTIDALALLAEAICQQQRWLVAGALAREAVRLATHTLPDDHETTLGARLALARVLAANRDPDAESELRILAVKFGRVHGPDHQATQDVRHVLVEVLRDEQHLNEAVSLASGLLAVREATQGPAHPHTLRLSAELARLLLRTGRPQDAMTLVEKALTAVEVHGAMPYYTEQLRDIRMAITHR